MADFEVQNEGSIALLRPLTPAAREWLAQNVVAESWQYFGDALAVEPRYLVGIVDAVIAEGMVVR